MIRSPRPPSKAAPPASSGPTAAVCSALGAAQRFSQSEAVRTILMLEECIAS